MSPVRTMAQYVPRRYCIHAVGIWADLFVFRRQASFFVCCRDSAEPRILMESTAALTLDYVEEYEDALSGDCIVQVPEVGFATEAFLVHESARFCLNSRYR